MPELPEVETTRRGIRSALAGRAITGFVLREPRLRWPVDRAIERVLPGRAVLDVRRRAKYLLVDVEGGSLLAHLGMSGSLRVLPASTPLLAHDHYDLCLDDGRCLRFNDPRRFGSLHWLTGDPAAHPLLADLGPEPLEPGFDADYLHRESRGRRVAVKPFLMDQRVVVGVGNIYASEALFRAGIHPQRASGRIGAGRYERLVAAVQAVLGEAIRQGGTTLRDYVSAEGTPGYFRQRLYVYERAGEPCRRCGRPIRQLVQGQRSTYFCPACQK
ncbi:MAG: bifunctional DNA-formamidopyrimidine glycosylase/DNA-(apurinic or apyrimidinic site) lyase [Lysobacterales bacterium]|nr:MAG: bifunctional DNA-formamidopyrimidine glycosylase/DNA-(apurinic or apyrimidinic site) lyase [Xanthomonadales bacterium]RPI13616.1 MAG: bifunctional DNA-formamidopyrimidine glycosylase/DNA-(apurinic or apyrimidinic site) lyase [Xanthomonadales bacterium]